MFKVTMQVLEAPGARVAGLQNRADTWTGVTRLMVAEEELPL